MSRPDLNLLRGLAQLPTDPFTLAAVVLALIVTAFLACVLPASRAARIDPVVALRHE